MNDSTVELLRQLIALPSVNPMGGKPDPAIHFEHRVTEFLERWFAARSIPTERQTAMPGTPDAPRRENLVALVAGRSDTLTRPLILLEAHQDTVPTGGMTIDPFGGGVKNGRVYGRGASDVKGSLACLLSVAERLSREPDGRRPAVAFAFTVSEEHGFFGAKHLYNSWSAGKSALLPRAPDAIIVSEPTDLNVVVAHKGLVRWKCRTAGKAVHSSTPEKGDNAIYRMAGVISALQRFHSDVLGSRKEHRLLGKPTLCVSMIRGGRSPNTVPDECSIDIDRRLLPGERSGEARQEVIEYLTRQLGGTALAHDGVYVEAPGLSSDFNEQLAGKLQPIAAQRHSGAKTIGVPYGTDAAFLSAAHVPTVVFGPGSIDQAHTADEWIEIAQLEKATEILTEFVTA